MVSGEKMTPEQIQKWREDYYVETGLWPIFYIDKPCWAVLNTKWLDNLVQSVDPDPR